MDPTECVVKCTSNLEWTNNQGTQIRRALYKSSVLRLIRNDFRDIYVEVSTAKNAAIKLHLKSINVHKKFMNEGKASIIFNAGDSKCTLLISNAPPSNLRNFLQMLFVKMTGEPNNNGEATSIRSKLLSKSSTVNSFEEISPVTVADFMKAKEKVQRTTDTTPSPGSRKRKLPSSLATKEANRNAPAAKRLYGPPIRLNEQQQRVLDVCLGGQNVFFTGSAGTGKSFLLRRIISALPPDVTVATASTGVAACHINGVTLHSFVGIGTGEGSVERCCQIASKPAVAQLWRKCKHLIIDEVSMVDAAYFEKIEAVARYIRRNEKPFGGIQLILCGDFFQLPPVNRRQSSTSPTKFCFQSSVWERSIHLSFELTQIHRQTDPEFIQILNNIRIGHVTSEMSTRLAQTAQQTIEQNGILATRLCSQNNDANIINESKLKELSGEVRMFRAMDNDSMYTKQLDQQTPVPGQLGLKVGAQVMLLKNVNIAAGLVNGARGIVTGFRNDLPVVRFRNNQEYVCKQEKWTVRTATSAIMIRHQIPLKLAWAFSIHKSQGLTLDCVEMSLARVFEAGQAYVALSRAQSLDTLRVLDFNTKQVWANPDVVAFYKRLKRVLEQTTLIPLGRKLASKSKPLLEIK